MSAIWAVMLIAGLLTFLIRLSFIYLLGKWSPPASLSRALRYVPPAVLSAIIFPELLIRNDVLAVTPYNFRMLAGLIAILVAWRTKNVILTIGVGMGVLLVLQTFMP